MADEKNNQDPKTIISDYVSYLSKNSGLTLPSGLGQDQKPAQYDYDEQLQKFAKNVSAPIAYEDTASFFRTYEAFDDHFTIINDVVLAGVPVLYNKFHSTNDVFVAETLRSTAPVVSSSGRQDWTLQLGLMFNPGKTQTYQLHRLVSVLQRFPIAYIYNKRIRKALGISTGDDTNTMFILETASMRNASDAVGSIVLDMTFHLFNYKPFSNHFWYNTRLPGYQRSVPEFNLQKRLIDAHGYEESEYAINNEAIILHESLRELPDLLGEYGNVPVPFPSSSDSWMYYADHLQKMTPKISERTNDFVGLSAKYFRQYKPPIPEARAGGDNARHANNTPFFRTPYHEFYNAMANPEVTSSDRRLKASKKGRSGLKIKGEVAARMRVLLPHIKKWSDTYGILPEYVYGLMKHESRGNPAAMHSKTKASGLGQIMPRTWENPKNGSGLKKMLGVDWPFEWMSSADHIPEQVQAVCMLVSNQAKNALRSYPGKIKPWSEDHVKLTDMYYGYGPAITKAFFKRRAVPKLGRNFTMQQLEQAFVDQDFRDFAIVFWTERGKKGKVQYWKERFGVRPIKHFNSTWNKVKRLINAEIFNESMVNPEITGSVPGTSQKSVGELEEQRRKQLEAQKRDQEIIKATAVAEAKAKEEYLARQAIKDGTDISGQTEQGIPPIGYEAVAALDDFYSLADQYRDEDKIKEEYEAAVADINPGPKDADIRSYWIEAMENEGLHYYRKDIQLRNVFYKNIRFDVDSEVQTIISGNGGIVLNAVSVGFGHRIAPQRLLSQDTCTYQFLGAGNKQGTLVFTFAGSKGRAAADNIKKIVYAARESARKFGSTIPEAGTIQLDLKKNNTTNNILSLIAKDDHFLNVVVSEIHESTSSSNPDTYQLVLEFIVQEIVTDKGLERSFGTTFENKKGVIKHVMETYLTASRSSDSPKYEWEQWIKPKSAYLVERYHGNAQLVDQGLGALNARGAYNEAARFKETGQFTRQSGYGRPYRLRDSNMPIWVANVIIAAAEICRDVDKIAPPTNWKDVDGEEWYKKYADYGAGELIKGRMKNLDALDANGLLKFQWSNHIGKKKENGEFVPPDDVANSKQLREKAIRKYERYFKTSEGGREYKDGAQLEQMFKGDYEWDSGQSRHIIDMHPENDAITGTNEGGKTDELANKAYDRFLSSVDNLYKMITVNMADEENFDKYFGSNSDELYKSLINDLGGCYDDLHVPNLPPISFTNRQGQIEKKERKLQLPLPPEFFIYDDSHEDPALASLTDPANMEQHLYEHIDNEIKSVARYIQQSVCGGSYLSRNLPNIAQQRKRYLEQFAGKDRLNEWAGEMGYIDWEPMMTGGCKTWDPIFHNEYSTTYNDPEKNSRKWMDFITSKDLENKSEYGEDIQLAWADKLIKLSPYLRDGHTMNGVSGWQDLGKEDIIETIYDNNWRGLSFGPNQIYTKVDTVMGGNPPDQATTDAADAAKREEDGFGDLRKQAIAENRPIDVPAINVTYLGSGDILVGRSVSTEYNDTLPENSKPTNWWSVGDTAVDVSSASIAILGGPPGLLGALTVKGLWEGGNYIWDAINDSKAEYIIENFEKKFKDATHPNAAKFAGGKQKGMEKMAQLTAGIAFGNKAKDLSVRRAFPTFKIYFIEDDSHQTDTVEGGQIVRAFDDFYSYSAIQEIRISRNRKVAADMATIRMTNIGGKLLRKRWGEREKWVDEANEISGVEAEYATGIFADTELENPFAKMMLQDGVKVQIRLGYANEPHALDTVFLGSIVEMSPSEGGKIIEVVCQGFGAELEGVELGPLEDGPFFYSTQQTLSGSIIQDSIVNFGRRSKYNRFNPGETRQRFIGGEGHGIFGTIGNTITMSDWKDRKLHKLFYRYPFRNFPQDDNIYAPPPSTYANFWDRFYNNACLYRPIKQTPWDIFKEHELRHPGFISLAVPYGHEPRMTMFFGAKAQHYWAHPPSAMELYLSEMAADDMINIRGMSADQRTSDQLLSKLDKLTKAYPKLSGAIIKGLVQETSPASVGKEVGRLFGRYRPFRNYHYFDSYHHILKNSIRTNVNGVYNEVEILYFENESNAEEDDAERLYNNIKSLSLGENGKYACKLDENIPEQYIKSYTAEFPSCVTEFMAKRYAQGLFARLLRDSYKGEVIVLGEPTLKPYDICYINDASVNMTGPVEVEGVEHIFNRDHGWISIITPDLCVDVNDFFSSTLFGAIGDALANTWNAAKSNDIVTAMTALASPIGYLGVMAGVKLGMWMQDGSPVVATPLTLGGKPFVSVSLGQDRVSLITSLKGKWNQYWDDLETGWAKVDIGETVFEESLDFQEWALTFFNPSPGEGIASSNGR